MAQISDEFVLSVSGGTLFHGVIWKAKKAKGNLVIGTGMCEHILRYEKFALFLNENGFNVYGLDFLSQGANAISVDKQMRWPEHGFGINLDALHETIVKAKSDTGLPTAVMCHSMGSFILQGLLERYPLSADRVILMGTNAGQAGLMKFGYKLTEMLITGKNWDKYNKTLENLSMGGYSKSVPNARTPFDWLSYNEDNVNAYIDDPYCGAKTTTGFWHGFLKGLSKIWLKKYISRVSADEKILIVSGADDCVGRNGKGPKWLEKAYKQQGVKDVSLILYPHMRHEILNEKENTVVYKDILDFLNK